MSEDGQKVNSTARTVEFWARASSIYLSYKLAQVHALGLRAIGWDDERLQNEHWDRQHTQAGQAMYDLCVDMRGFFLKVCCL